MVDDERQRQLTIIVEAADQQAIRAREGAPNIVSATLGRKIDVTTSTNVMTTLTLTVSVQPFSLEEAIRRANDLLEGRRPDDEVSTGD